MEQLLEEYGIGVVMLVAAVSVLAGLELLIQVI